MFYILLTVVLFFIAGMGASALCRNLARRSTLRSVIMWAASFVQSVCAGYFGMLAFGWEQWQGSVLFLLIYIVLALFVTLI